ncbi:hypothetical protein ACKLNO_06365 [Neisseriaceae bacterium B1]
MPTPSPYFQWLQQSNVAPTLVAHEQPFFQAASMLRRGDCVLSIDTPPKYFQAALSNNDIRFILQNQNIPADIIANAVQTPWRDHEFDTLIAAHRTDWHSGNENLALLVEWYRITKSQGKLLLTTFNPHTLCRIAHSEPSPFANLVSPKKLIQQAENLGWQLEQCRFLLHTPFFRQPENTATAQIIDKILAFSLPQSAAVYGLVFSKPTACLTPNQAISDPTFAHLTQLNLAQKNLSGSLRPLQKP